MATAKQDVSKWRWLIGPVITIVIIIAGFVASWATYKAALVEVQKDVVRLERKVDENEARVRDVELKDAGDTQILLNIQSDVSEIKKKVDQMIE